MCYNINYKVKIINYMEKMMKKNNLVKALASLSAAILIGIGLNETSQSVHAADTATSSSSVTQTTNTNSKNGKDASQTVNLSVAIPTVDVTVKTDNPVLYSFPVKNSAGATAKTEKSEYKAGETVKVQYYINLTDNDSKEPVKGYYVGSKEIDGESYAQFILADDVTTTAAVPTYDELSKTMQDKIAAAKKEYEEKAKADAKKQAEDLKKRFLYYTAKKKSTKKTLYYYTGYSKTTKVKKTKKTKTTIVFKKNKYKIKAKTLKLDQGMKVGKKTYYHIKGKSANFWVRSTDVKDLKPVFRKK